jgi:hypothetical protein
MKHIFFLFTLTLEDKANLSVSSIIFADGRTPWTGDQPVSRPLPKPRTTNTQNKRTHTTSNIHDLCGLRTHDLGFRAIEDSTFLSPLGYRHPLTKHRISEFRGFLILTKSHRRQTLDFQNSPVWNPFLKFIYKRRKI